MNERDTNIDLSVQPLQPDKSLGELFGAMTADLSRLTRQEIQLAKVELQEEGRRAGRVGAMFAAAAAVALIGAIVLAMAGSWLLDQWMPRALAFLIVAAVLLAVAAVLASRARREAGTIHPVPQQTVDTLKEDVAWAKAQRS
jgi:MFS family permease